MPYRLLPYCPGDPYPCSGPGCALPVNRADAEIQHDVVDALRHDAYVDASQIYVATTEGVVTLTGTVHTVYQKRLAGNDAWGVPGVMGLHNDLVITG
jgi:osmotically-inducible protein OsmY